MDGSFPIRITREGDHQVVHLPPEIEAPGDAVIRREGHKLIIESPQPSSQKRRLLDLLATLEPLEEEIGPIERHPARPFSL